MLVRAVLDVAQQAIAIVRADNLGKGQVRRNLLRHTELVQLNTRIGRDDRASAKVHALSHQVATDTSGLRTKAGLQSAQRTTRTLGRGIHALDVIVYIGCDMILEQSRVLVQHLGRLSLVDLLADLVVCAQDIDQHVRQIILHALVVIHHHRRANRQGRDSQHRAHHPLRASELGIQSDGPTVVIRDALEGAEDHLGLKIDRVRFGVRQLSLQGRSLAHDLGDLLEDGRLAVRALEWLILLRRRAHVADLLEPRQTRRLQRLHVLLRSQDLGAVQADHIRQLLHHVKELIEVDRAGQPDVAEMTRAELVRLLACGADLAVFNDAETRIEDAICNGLIVLVCLVCDDLDNGALEQILGVCNAELDTDDRITHG